MSRIFARLAAVAAGLIAPAVLATAALAGTCPSQSNGPDFGPALSDWHPGLHSPYTNGTVEFGAVFGHSHARLLRARDLRVRARHRARHRARRTEHGTGGHGTNHGTRPNPGPGTVVTTAPAGPAATGPTAAPAPAGPGTGSGSGGTGTRRASGSGGNGTDGGRRDRHR